MINNGQKIIKAFLERIKDIKIEDINYLSSFYALMNRLLLNHIDSRQWSSHITDSRNLILEEKGKLPNKGWWKILHQIINFIDEIHSDSPGIAGRKTEIFNHWNRGEWTKLDYLISVLLLDLVITNNPEINK